MLAGRARDLSGRRRFFVIGLALLTLASLSCGLAPSPAVLVVARAVQGVGAAVVSPATLSLLTTAFREGEERNRALCLRPRGGRGRDCRALGRGAIVGSLGWEWLFFVNVPIGVLAGALAPALLPESRDPGAARLAENIGYGRPGATREEIEAAARAVSAHGFILELPGGYDTVLGAGGNLSQGQRQLLSFARAVLADPRILILDEATSNIDTRTEAIIQQALGTLLKGRTSLAIAHRLSTIRTADLILVVAAGRIAERGTHAGLLERGGLYADLYRRQSREPVAS